MAQNRLDALLVAAITAAEALDGDSPDARETARSGLRRALARHGIVDCDDCGRPTRLRTMRVAVRGGGTTGQPRRIERRCARCSCWWGWWRRSGIGAALREHLHPKSED